MTVGAERKSCEELEDAMSAGSGWGGGGDAEGDESIEVGGETVGGVAGGGEAGVTTDGSEGEGVRGSGISAGSTVGEGCLSPRVPSFFACAAGLVEWAAGPRCVGRSV